MDERTDGWTREDWARYELARLGENHPGAVAFREGVSYEANPHVPGGPDVAQFCRLDEWPLAARDWHVAWSSSATLKADAAAKEVPRG